MSRDSRPEVTRSKTREVTVGRQSIAPPGPKKTSSKYFLYTAADNPRAADSLLARIDSACILLAANPELGPARTDLEPDLHDFVVGRTLILYRRASDRVEVVRIVHGARSIHDLFKA